MTTGDLNHPPVEPDEVIGGEAGDLSALGMSHALSRAQFLKRAGVVGAGVSAASFVAACGGSSSSKAKASTTTSSSSGVPASGSSGVKASTTGSALKNKKIGIPAYSLADQNETILISAMETASKEAGLGWTFHVTDTNANQSTAQSAVEAYITQGVDAIMLMVVPAAFVEAQLAMAKAKNIPVFGNYTFAPNDPNITLDYSAPLQEDEVPLSLYLLNDQTRRHGASSPINVAILDVNLDVVAVRRPIFDAISRGAQWKNVKVVAIDANVDTANPVTGATSATRALLTAHPEINCFWVNYPPQALPCAEAVAQAGKSGSVQVYGHIVQSAGLEAILSGTSPLVAASWLDLQYNGWGLIDAMLSHFGGVPLSRLAYLTNGIPTTAVDKTLRGSAAIQKIAAGSTDVVNWVFNGGAYTQSFLSNWHTVYGVAA